MLQAMEEEAPEAGRILGLSRRLKSIAASAFTYWTAVRAARLLADFSHREEVAIWALVMGGLAYMALSTLFVYFVYARRCFSGKVDTTTSSVLTPVAATPYAGTKNGGDSAAKSAGVGRREGNGRKGGGRLKEEEERLLRKDKDAIHKGQD